MKRTLIPVLPIAVLMLAFPLHADPMSKVIATAVQRSTGIYVYNDKGTIIATLNGGSGPKDGLVGYTATTISIRRGSTIYVYNANGRIINTVNAR